ncbi:MAG TPA: metal ABC transporter substrate-binding protein [Bacteroidota bacterium]|nr:metal ABC transporter substrate-binding protein [Bacteroidota bacterium]
MKRICHIWLVLVLTAYFNAAYAQEKLKVVTTLNYLGMITKEVGGEHVDVVVLANPKQDPHYVTPTPRMNETTRGANLFIENGLSLDLWAKNVLDASGNPEIQPGNPGHLVATINVPVRELPTEISRSWGDIHPQGNPHIWLDPLNVKIVADNIAGRLSKLDPVHAKDYARGSEQFRSRIDKAMFGEALLKAIGSKAGEILTRKMNNDQLEDWLKSKNLLSKLGGWVAAIQPIKGSKIVTYHKTYVYFADRFGFKIVGELEEKPGIPPPPQRRDEIVEEMRRQNVKVILNDNFYSREASEYVASKTNAKVIITYIDVNGTEEIDSYEKLIQYLIENLTVALR